MAISLTSVLIIGFFFINIAVSDQVLFPRLCRPSTLLVHVLFVATFGLSASLLQLCCWEITGSLENEYHPRLSAWYGGCEQGLTGVRARGAMWKILVTALLADLIVIIPLVVSYSLIANYIPKRSP
jgi:hypothetical protein